MDTKQKSKFLSFNPPALVYMSFFVLFLVAGIIGSIGINSITKRFRSIYKQRLVPALEIFFVVEKQYQNRFALEEYISGISHETKPKLEQEMSRNNKQIDSIIVLYSSANPLENLEYKDLRRVRNGLKNYRQIETQIIKLCHQNQNAQARKLFMEASYQAFQQIVEPLEQLETDQTELGRNLYEQAEQAAVRAKTALYLIMLSGVLLATIVAIVAGQRYTDF